MRHAGAMALLGWLLLFSRDPRRPIEDWQQVGAYPTEYICAQGRTAEIDRDALARIGQALASQPADNPVRQDAYQRAARTVRDRYRCVRE